MCLFGFLYRKLFNATDIQTEMITPYSLVNKKQLLKGLNLFLFYFPNFKSFIFFQASSNHRSSGQTASQQPPAEDSATKRAAISRIFPVKKSTPNSRNGHSPAPTSVSGNTGSGSTGGGKAVPVKVIKVEEPPPVVKTDPAPILPLAQQPLPPTPSTPTPQMLNPTILKRLDGRPILLCRIPLR